MMQALMQTVQNMQLQQLLYDNPGSGLGTNERRRSR